MRSITSETAISTLLKRIFFVFGIPEDVVSDNGKQFISHKFQNFLSKYNIRHILTPKYSPQSNSAERVNRTILSAIRSYLQTDQRDWDVHLYEIGGALRTAFHDSIKRSPYQALFGRHMITNGEQYKILRELDCLGESEILFVDPETNFEKIRNSLTLQISLASEKHAHNYNLRSKNRSFLVGQNIYVKNFVQSDATKQFAAKLAPKFIPAQITEKIGKVAYRCVDKNGKSLGVFHLKDIHSLVL